MYKEADLYDFINAPIGKGLAISKALRPLIASACPVCMSTDADPNYIL